MPANSTVLVAAAPALARNLKSGRDTAISSASNKGRAQGAGAAKLHLVDKLAFSIEEAVQSSSLGQTSIYQAIREGKLIMRKYGSRSVITRDDLVAFLNGLPVA